jgi:hypothetical protein
MANYSCKCVKASHIFLKKALRQMSASLASPGKVGWRMSTNVSSPGKVGWRMLINVSSPGKVGWRMAANLASPTNFPKGPFWRVLKFDKFAVEWPLLSNNTIMLCVNVKYGSSFKQTKVAFDISKSNVGYLASEVSCCLLSLKFLLM